MRQCQCGGTVRQHQLTGNREAWTCNDCGRYENVQRQEPPTTPAPPPEPENEVAE